jgi:hypothetical protein
MFGDFLKLFAFLLFFSVWLLMFIGFLLDLERKPGVLGVVLPSSSLLLNIRAWSIDHHCMINQQFLSYLFFQKKTICFGR